VRDHPFFPPAPLLALAIAALGSLCAVSSESPDTPAAESGPGRGAAAAERPPNAAPAGEDLGEASEAGDLWQRIGQSMRTVEQRIREKKTSSETQRIQQQIVDDLTRLIEDGQRQGRGVESPAATQNTAESASTEPGDRPGSGAATASSGSPGKAQGTQAELFLKVWGRLPAQLQQQIQSPVHEEFLPEYETLIREYYRRLAEGERK
jgi:hypothetical protein